MHMVWPAFSEVCTLCVLYDYKIS